MLPQEKRVKRKREDADANANADGRHAGVSDNNVVHVEAEAHVTHPTDATEQHAADSSCCLAEVACHHSAPLRLCRRRLRLHLDHRPYVLR